MVKRRTLLLIAGFVWAIAGFNILKIGVESYVGYVHIRNLREYEIFSVNYLLW